LHVRMTNLHSFVQFSEDLYAWSSRPGSHNLDQVCTTYSLLPVALRFIFMNYGRYWFQNILTFCAASTSVWRHSTVYPHRVDKEFLLMHGRMRLQVVHPWFRWTKIFDFEKPTQRRQWGLCWPSIWGHSFISGDKMVEKLSCAYVNLGFF